MRFDKENDFTEEIKDLQNNENNMLGTPKAHLFKNFIVAQNDNELVIVDQHAAHERILYEKLKTQKYDQGIAVQELLVPEIVEFTRVEVDAIIEKQSVMKQLGLEIERFGPASICIRGVPALLGEVCPKTLLIDLLEDLENLNTLESLENKIDKVFSSMACHGSVRSGRILKYEEMDNLLREMEKTPNSDQCNHGRPTYLKLDLEKINKLFGRT
jgi:DNA mismatch repair protein MutL